MRQGKIVILSGFVFALFFFLMGKDQQLTEDMVIHLSFVKKIQNPTLFSGDYLLESPNPQLRYTFYYPLLADISPGLDSLAMSRVTYFGAAALFCTGLLLLIHKLRGSWFAGIIFLTLLAFRFQVGGAAIPIMETEPLPRFLALVFVVWSIYFLFEMRFWLSLILTLLGFFIHPLTIVYYLTILTGCHLFHNKLTVQSKISALAILGVVLAVILLFISPMPVEWLAIVKARNPYAFMTMWGLRSWLNLGLLCLPGVVNGYFCHTKKIWKKLFAATLLTAIFISILHLGFISFYPVSSIVSLQLGRIWIFPVWVSLIIFSLMLSARIRTKWKRLLLLGVIWLLVIANGVRLKPKDTQVASWQVVATWAKVNSDTTCTFLVPFYNKGFRVLSERPIVGEYKDGALSFYSEAFARDWWQRTNSFIMWESLSTAELTRLSSEYGFDYLVERTPGKRDLVVAYTNPDYVVYDFRQNGRCI